MNDPQVAIHMIQSAKAEMEPYRNLIGQLQSL